MIQCATLRYMELTERLQVIGKLVREEADGQYLSNIQLAERMNVERNTVQKIMRGDSTVSPPTIRRAEAALGMPRGLLEHVREGEVDAIRALRTIPGEADLIRRALELLGEPLQTATDQQRKRHG